MGIVCLWVSVFLGPGRFIPRPMGEPPWLKVHSRPKGTQVLSCLGDKNERTYGRKIASPWDIRHFPRDSFDLIWFVGTKLLELLKLLGGPFFGTVGPKTADGLCIYVQTDTYATRTAFPLSLDPSANAAYPCYRHNCFRPVV